MKLTAEMKKMYAGGMTFKAIADTLGVNETTVGRAFRPRIRASIGRPPIDKSQTGKSFADFQSLYDKDFIVPDKIKAGLKALGPNSWEYESTFARLAGVSLTELCTYREQFIKYVVLLSRESRRAWAGSKAMADKMKEKL